MSDEKPSWFWIAFFIALLTDICLRVIEKLDFKKSKGLLDEGGNTNFISSGDTGHNEKRSAYANFMSFSNVDTCIPSIIMTVVKVS